MAPRKVEEQTNVIVHCLFEGVFEVRNKQCFTEPDGPVTGEKQEGSFDPALIAEKLRKLGDDYDEKVIQPLITEVQKAAIDEVQATFKKSVEHLCETWPAQSGEVASERQLLKASVILGLYAKRNCPDLGAVIQGALTVFINTHLAPWVSQQGGWEHVSLE